MKRYLSVLVLTVGLTFFAQYVIAQSAPKKVPRDSNAEAISKLQNEVSELRKEVYRLRYEQLSKLWPTSVTVKTDSKNYGIARTKFGPFIISQGGLTEFLDGYKLKLLIGNTTSVVFRGATLTLEWGPPYDEKNVSKWFQERKKKEVEVTDTFLPGINTIVEVVISPAKPEEAKEIEVGIDLNELSFRANP